MVQICIVDTLKVEIIVESVIPVYTRHVDITESS